MWFNKKKRTKESADDYSAKDRIARQLVAQLLRVQCRWAALMQRFCARLSPVAQKFYLVGFVGCSFGYCLYLVIGSFYRLSPGGIDAGFIRTPAYVTKSTEPITKSSQLVSAETYRQLLGFRLWMDSLQLSTNGRSIADSIRVSRPGLLDSIAELEKLYQLQQLKK